MAELSSHIWQITIRPYITKKRGFPFLDSLPFVIKTLFLIDLKIPYLENRL